jgi:hypothetical protein
VVAPHRPDKGVDRARRVGRRLADRLALDPPVAIEAVVSAYADVEFDSIPAACDGVVFGLTTSRPTVIVDQYQPPRRLRFSLAHELGHILVPGHLGVEVCHTSSRYISLIDFREREAHAFASEVLLPTRWLTRVIDNARSVGDVLSELNIAEVSAAAACLGVVRALPAGVVVALMRGNHVEMSLASPGTVANLPDQDADLDPRQLDAFSEDGGAAEISSRTVRWWVFPTRARLPVAGDRSAAELLWTIVQDVFVDEPSQRTAYQRVSAITGHAKGAYAFRTAEELHANVRARLAARPDLADVIGHPLFAAYLARRTLDLAGQR